MDAKTRRIESVTIFILMFPITILVLTLVSWPLDYLLTYKAAVEYNKSINSFYLYIFFYLAYRSPLILSILFLFAEIFKHNIKKEFIWKMVYIIFACTLAAGICESEASVSIHTEYKRFFTYPISGLLTYGVYTICFQRTKGAFKRVRNANA